MEGSIHTLSGNFRDSSLDFGFALGFTGVFLPAGFGTGLLFGLALGFAFGFGADFFFVFTVAAIPIQFPRFCQILPNSTPCFLAFR